MGGTVPKNYPPLANMEIGERITGTSTGNNATLASTIFFTAPNPGLYLVAGQVRIVATDGDGTLEITVTLPNAEALSKNSLVALQNPDLDPIKNGYSPTVPVWMATGDTIRCGVEGADLTGDTVYDVYVTAERML